MLDNPQGEMSLRAYALKARADRMIPGRRRRYVPDGIVVHGTGKRTPVKREVFVDRSIYTGDILREIRRRNGSGKGPLQLARRAARKAIHASGDRRPGWMRVAEAERLAAAD